MIVLCFSDSRNDSRRTKLTQILLLFLESSIYVIYEIHWYDLKNELKLDFSAAWCVNWET